jgi:P4 family phage/plasmid primase-like protien
MAQIGQNSFDIDADELESSFQREMKAIDKRYGIGSESQPKKDVIFEAVDYLEAKYRFVSIEETGEIRYWKNGVYVSGGEVLIEKESQAKFREQMTTHKIREIKEHIKRDNPHKLEEFDADLDIINLENGLYNWKEDRFILHDPSHLSLRQVTFPYNKNAKPQRLGKFLSEVLYPADIRTTFELVAYSFYHDTPFEFYTILVGTGANGKSVLTGVLTKLHGEKNVSNVPMKYMVENRFALADLEGRAVNIDTELSSGTISDLAVLKKLTGRQPIRIENKNTKAHDVRLFAKLWFNANKFPQSDDDTDARHRREISISFPNQFEGRKADPDLLSKLTTKEELSGVFNVLMIALRRIMNTKGVFVNEKTIAARKEKFEMQRNPIAKFVEEHIERDLNGEGSQVVKEELYADYRAWGKKHVLPIEQYDSFCKILKNKHGFVSDRETIGKRKHVWTGVRRKKLTLLTT